MDGGYFIGADVANANDLTSAALACTAMGPVVGVVHAGMGLHEQLLRCQCLEDAFAYWRRTQGKPAVLIGLGMVSELKALSKVSASVLAAEASATSLRNAIRCVIGKQFSYLILMPLDEIEYDRSFAQLGVDSMIASEFRTWFWDTFQVDVPFLDLPSAEKNLDTIVARVESAIVEPDEKV